MAVRVKNFVRFWPFKNIHTGSFPTEQFTYQKLGHHRKFHDQFELVFRYYYHPPLLHEILDEEDLSWVTKSDESHVLTPAEIERKTLEKGCSLCAVTQKTGSWLALVQIEQLKPQILSV